MLHKENRRALKKLNVVGMVEKACLMRLSMRRYRWILKEMLFIAGGKDGTTR